MKNPFKKESSGADLDTGSADKEISSVESTKKQSHQKTLLGFMQIILIAVVALVSGLVLTYTFLLNQSENEIAEVSALGESKALAAALGNQLARYQDIAASLASNHELVQLLQSGQADADDLKEAAKKLRFNNSIRGVVGINILPLSWNRIDKSRLLPISYASLDLIKQAKNMDKIPPAELHAINTKKVHIAITTPIKSGKGKLIGILHIGWPLKDIQSLFQRTQFSGKIALAQFVEKRGVLVVTKGKVSLTDSSLEKTPVTNSIWSLVSDVNSGSLPVIGLILAALGLLGIALIAGIMFIQLKRLKYAMRQDQAKIVEMLDRSADGNALASPSSSIYENQDTMELVARNLNTLQSNFTKKSQIEKTKPTAKDNSISTTGAFDGGGGRTKIEISPSIFRAYDIRGVVDKTLTTDAVYEIGRAIGSVAYEKGQQTVLIARDGRHSGSDLSASLAEGIMASGRDVIDVGMVPTPVLYFCTHFLGANSGVMITGSHNPPEYNGLKIVIGGEALAGPDIQNLRQRIEEGNLLEGRGNLTDQDVSQDYIERITGDAALGRAMKVVVDAGNGVAGPIAVQLLEEMGCEVIQLYCDIDGDFPNHHPDPGKPANLEDLRAMVKNEQADIGIAFDGDGDRIGVVDSNAKVILPDRLLMLLAADVLTRQPGADIIYDIKSTKNLANHILMAGGRPVMWKTGHSFIKQKMRETGAVLAGEMSGHIFYKERWYGFDDAIYTCARLLEIVSLDGRNTSEIFAELPDSVNTPELNLTVEEGVQHALVKRLQENADFADAQVIDIDGLRVEFSNGWGLVRASNTTPSLVFRFEADDPESLKEIQNIFRDFLLRVDSSLSLPF